MRRTIIALIAAAAVGVAGAWVFLRPARPNVLLITIDTMRSDRLGCYDYAKAKTPNLDRLAAEGVVFSNAFCDVTWTGPSLASTMTGTYATTHGMRSSYQKLGDDSITLAETLRGAGYQTAAVIGSFPASSIFGFGQGFDTFDENLDTPILQGGKFADEKVPLEFHDDIEAQNEFQIRRAQSEGYRSDQDVTTAALAWLGKNEREPFFLWVHYFGPHEKMDVRLNVYTEIRRSMDVYDQDVTAVDAAIGRLLDDLRKRNVLDKTVVVLHADHGQSLAEHDYFGHGRYLYDEVLRIPMIVRYPPSVPVGKRVREQARNIDILPTILDLASTDPPPGRQGRTLVPSMKGAAGVPEKQETYCETYLSATHLFSDIVQQEGREVRIGFRRRGIRTPRYLFVENTPWPFLDESNPEPISETLRQTLYHEELYDIASDPEELKNLAEEQPRVLEEFRARLQGYVTDPVEGARRELDEASKERLRNLGYLKN